MEWGWCLPSYWYFLNFQHLHTQHWLSFKDQKKSWGGCPCRRPNTIPLKKGGWAYMRTFTSRLVIKETHIKNILLSLFCPSDWHRDWDLRSGSCKAALKQLCFLEEEVSFWLGETLFFQAGRAGEERSCPGLRSHAATYWPQFHWATKKAWEDVFLAA